ncbi:ATP-dependent helicase [uncultured Ilyobacter sp.]|uniref:ATP-dependent helicase n=1 Tax=uncultured Ilyobacter sp. TaxID=544433 RepID=UPI0029C8DE0A|nr:ATP-dependent helicase [uncultured Ilyobacter sp.]
MNIDFREEQKKILKYREGRLGIPAVPGAGKTFILSHLAAKLIEEDLEKDEEILILTYMNSSVINFKNRIDEILGSEAGLKKRFQVMTIHKLTNEILRDNLYKIGLSNEYKTITNANMFHLISMAINDYKKDNLNEIDYFIDPPEKTEKSYKKWNDELIRVILRLISRCKNLSISPEKLNSETKKYAKGSLLKIAGEVYLRYDRLCKREGFLDYDDLLYLCHKILSEDTDLCESYKKKYKYIFEDEAQDSNYLQNKILRLISNGNLVKVGDLNQSILSTFTSSSPKLFKSFLRANPKAEMFTAGRSSREIIDLANFFVDYVRREHPLKEARGALAEQMIREVDKGSFPANPEVETYGIKTFMEETEDKELERMGSFIEVFSKKYPDKKAAVLFPKNFQIEKAGRVLKKKQVKFQVLADISENLLETLEFMGDLLAFLSKPFDNRRLVTLIQGHLMESIEEDEFNEFISYLRGIDLEKIFYRRDELTIPEKFISASWWKIFEKNLKKIKLLLEFPQNSLEKLLLFIGDIYSFEADQLLLIEKISLDLKRIFKLNPRWTLFDLSLEMKKSRGSEFTYLAKAVESETEEIPTPKYNITLTTYHKSKGMEWDMVWLFNVNSDSFPVYLSDNDYGRQQYLKEPYVYPGDYLEEEFRKTFINKEYKNITLKRKSERISESIRLLYVGITRAKEYLVISCNEGSDTFYFREISRLIEEGQKRYERRKKG